MIDPRELRIGNLVYTQGRKLITLKDKIIAIDKVVPQSCQNYEPIPVTPEWLERAGFEKINHIADGVIYRREWLIFRTYESESMLIVWGCEWRGGSIKKERASHLHQLQNLYFALTGEELEIKMP